MEDVTLLRSGSLKIGLNVADLMITCWSLSEYHEYQQFSSPLVLLTVLLCSYYKPMVENESKLLFKY